jgi:hypothetical protein
VRPKCHSMLDLNVECKSKVVVDPAAMYTAKLIRAVKCRHVVRNAEVVVPPCGVIHVLAWVTITVKTKVKLPVVTGSWVSG